jgi:Sulfotransferase family
LITRAVDAPEADFPHPVFVGGSARSGSHAVGGLVGSHPRYHLVAAEARFHCWRGGLCDVLNGRADPDLFRERTLGEWWRRGLRHSRGLRTLVGRRRLVAALDEFRETLAADRWLAGRRLMEAVFEPGARRAGKPAWVELSGANIQNAPTLLRLFPAARFVHTVRDGRAVTAALLRKRGATDDRGQAFEHWMRRVRRSQAGLERLPPGSVETIMLEDFAAHDRERTFARLLRLLDLEDPGPMREYFDREVSAERAHVGAWRQRIAPADARWLDRRYARAIRQLRREGIDWLREPSDAGG